MAEATFVQDGEMVNFTADAAYSAGDVIQLPDGRAGVVSVEVESGKIVGVFVGGIFKVLKTASIGGLTGGRSYWDHSANKCHYKKVNDRDFYLGRYTADALGSASVAYVALNIDPPYDIDINRDAVLSVPTGTQVAGAFGHVKQLGGAHSLELTATNEAQCIDMLSVDRFAKGSKAIVESIFRLPVNGSTSDVDINIGIGNGTSTTDADAVTEHVLFHIDGGALTILAQSKDGTTTVAAETTTVSATAGSAVSDRVELWIDTRTQADVQLWVNGVNVNTATAFKIDAATGPFGLLAHIEKVSGTATGRVVIDALRAHYAQA